ncbi:MAG: hypothetical protein LUI60_06725 [Clostridia bacterium]|nr:hypothetical protein [Clostridia bacterium]
MRAFFINGLINKVVLYDDKICIYYNTSYETADEVRMTEKKEGSFLNFPPDESENNKCDSFKFKRVALGAAGSCVFELFTELGVLAVSFYL